MKHFSEDMRTITIDWAAVTDRKQLWNLIVRESGHPDWHGRNLHALRDGWITGGLDAYGPPYHFIFRNCQRTPHELVELCRAIVEVAFDSVLENGGQMTCSG